MTVAFHTKYAPKKKRKDREKFQLKFFWSTVCVFSDALPGGAAAQRGQVITRLLSSWAHSAPEWGRRVAHSQLNADTSQSHWTEPEKQRLRGSLKHLIESSRRSVGALQDVSLRLDTARKAVLSPPGLCGGQLIVTWRHSKQQQLIREGGCFLRSTFENLPWCWSSRWMLHHGDKDETSRRAAAAVDLPR